MANRNKAHFVRATILDHASYIVGLPGNKPRTDGVWDTVGEFNKRHPRLELPHPSDILDIAKHIGLVSYGEFRRHQKLSTVWDVIGDNYIMVENVRTGSRIKEGHVAPISSLRMDRPQQLEMLVRKGDLTLEDDRQIVATIPAAPPEPEIGGPVSVEALAGILSHFDEHRLVRVG